MFLINIAVAVDFIPTSVTTIYPTIYSFTVFVVQ